MKIIAIALYVNELTLSIASENGGLQSAGRKAGTDFSENENTLISKPN